MAYSYVRYTLTSGNMGTNSFSYSAFQTLGSGADPENTQFNVFWGDSELVLDTDYTVNTTTNTVTFLSPVTADWVEGDVIAIKRDTKKDDRYVDWTNNAGIDETDLDLEGDQLLFIAQEAWDEAQNALRKNAAGTKWYGQGLESYNCAPATLGSGWVTLDQVNNLINGGDTATLGETNEWCFTGDGTTDDFVLNGAAANTDVGNLIISIDGRLLCPCDPINVDTDLAAALDDGTTLVTGVGITNTRGNHATGFVSSCSGVAEAALALLDLTVGLEYHAIVTASPGGSFPAVNFEIRGDKDTILDWINGWPNNVDNISVTYDSYPVGYSVGYTWTQATRTVTFTNPPADGADICIRQLTGTVAVDLADVSLDGSEIQDDAITIDHLDFAAGTAYRVLKVDAAGDPSVGTITSAYISDFTAAVQSLQWRTMIAPTSSVSMGTQKITNLQAGVDAGDGVNFGQLTAATDRIDDLETAQSASGPNSGYTSSVTVGIQPDLWYNNASNSRGVITGDGSITACNTEATADDNQVLLRGFVPRWVKIYVYGCLARVSDSVVRADNVNHEWEFYNWDAENGLTNYTTEGNKRVYLLRKPWKMNPTPSLDYPHTNVDSEANFYLVIEQVSPWRVWFRMKDDSSAVLKVTRYGQAVGDVATLPGSLQVVASKGL